MWRCPLPGYMLSLAWRCCIQATPVLAEECKYGTSTKTCLREDRAFRTLQAGQVLLRLAAAYADRLVGLQGAITAGEPAEDGGSSLDPQAAGGLLGTLACQDTATAAEVHASAEQL